jgi:hypothetical protein
MNTGVALSRLYVVCLADREHISTDIAVDAGRAVWFGHTRGVAGPDQTSEYWEINTAVELR